MEDLVMGFVSGLLVTEVVVRVMMVMGWPAG